MITDTISWVEGIWTALAVAGVGITGVNLFDAITDLHLVRAVMPRNGRHAIAKSQVRSEAVHLLSMLGFVLIGVYAMSLPNRTHGLSFATVMLIIIEAAMIVNSVMDAHLRRYLTREMPKFPEGLH